MDCLTYYLLTEPITNPTCWIFQREWVYIVNFCHLRKN